jgi:subtilisin family serine protease
VTAPLTIGHHALAGATGRGIRIAVIDSGIAAGHPHVGALSLGVSLVGDDLADTADRVGHGTAVAGAIREKAPGAELIPVRVLERDLATSARILARAIVWAAENGAQIVNLSLGTRNEAHVPLFEDALATAHAHGVLVVSSARHDDVAWYPGALEGCVGVVADASLPRDGVHVVQDGDATRLAASPYPRPIPGVPVERNLSGVSFAVANATGLLALALEAGAPTSSVTAVLQWIADASA